MNKSDSVCKIPRPNPARIQSGAGPPRQHHALGRRADALAAWHNGEMLGRRGRPRIYTDTAIECALIVKAVFHLSLRAARGFVESIVRLTGVGRPVPDYTTVSRRQAGLNVVLPSGASPAARPVVIDATGLKVYGAGEWHVRKYGMGQGSRREISLQVLQCHICTASESAPALSDTKLGSDG